MRATKTTLADLRRLRAEREAKKAPAKAATRPARARKPRAPKEPRPAQPVEADPAEAADGLDSAPAPLDPADRALFAQAMRFVRPLARHGSRARGAWRREADTLLGARRAHAQGEDAQQEPPAPRRRRRAAAPPDPEAPEFLQTGCGPDLLRGLRRGKWLPQAVLDLHGSSEDEAHERLDRFIESCSTHDIRCVQVIHGKGMGSRHGAPVLKSAVRIHLCRLPAVQAWVQSAEAAGGAGAVTVLLRRAGAAGEP